MNGGHTVLSVANLNIAGNDIPAPAPIVYPSTIATYIFQETHIT